MDKKPTKKTTYREAGVDIDRGNQLVQNIKPYIKETLRPEVLSGIGGFGALCELPKGYRHPVLVSGTDGVGTKLKLALKLQKIETIGIDLVAMCVNDIITLGAEPLFFLDYFATSKLDNDQATSIIKSIAEGCLQAGCALTGGETAEMPGLYQKNDFDLAGFTVGVVEKDKIIDGSNVAKGDSLIALASSGPHSNGYSLIRHIIQKHNIDIDSERQKQLLEPTRIYVKSILTLLQKTPIHAIAHITGGGIVENLPRVMPKNLQASIDYDSWERPEIFKWIQTQGQIEEAEMRRAFNLGVGMILCIAPQHTTTAIDELTRLGENAWVIGKVTE